jgi:hypothetical protein
MTRIAALALILSLVPQVDVGKILEKADALLEEAKAGYEKARAENSAPTFVDAGFKLEEARIKYLVLQEVGSPEQQKTAADRMRAVNQLAKLIHDGKVAVSGAAVDSPSPPPPPAENKPDAPVVPKPAAKPDAPQVGAMMVDVSRRSVVPDAARQKDAEKIIKDLFKDQYAKKTAADRRTLGRLLLDQAVKTPDDPAAAWVMFRESQDAAVQGFDPKTAVESVEASAKLFDVDPLPVKSSLFAAMAKGPRTPEENATLAEYYLRLVEDHVAADQYDAADKAATAALAVARKSNDAGLAIRTTTRAREIAEAKTRFTALKGVMQTLASKPDDPAANLEMGLYLCYVKGSWDLGTRFLIKGSDPVLKALAEKEVAMPVGAVDRTALADGWFDLAQKETSPLRKSQLLSHAGALYESALPDANGLLRVRIEKRMETAKPPAGPQGPSIDLLKMIDAKRDAVSGDWSMKRGVLRMPAGRSTAWLQIPYAPPDEYDLKIVATRKTGITDLYVGVVVVPGPKRLLLHIDGSSGGADGGLQSAGGDWNNNPTSYRNIKTFSDDKPKTVFMSVRRTSFTLVADGKTLISWKGDFTNSAGCNDTPNNSAFYIGNWEAVFEVSQILLYPIDGKGKPVPHVR